MGVIPNKWDLAFKIPQSLSGDVADDLREMLSSEAVVLDLGLYNTENPEHRFVVNTALRAGVDVYDSETKKLLHHNSDGNSIAEEAISIVRGARNEYYGHPEEDFGRLAQFWTLALKGRGRLADDAELDHLDIVHMMALVKINRNLNKFKRDNLVDLAGYAETWSLIEGRREEGK